MPSNPRTDLGHQGDDQTGYPLTCTPDVARHGPTLGRGGGGSCRPQARGKNGGREARRRSADCSSDPPGHVRFRHPRKGSQHSAFSEMCTPGKCSLACCRRMRQIGEPARPVGKKRAYTLSVKGLVLWAEEVLGKGKTPVEPSFHGRGAERTNQKNQEIGATVFRQHFGRKTEARCTG